MTDLAVNRRARFDYDVLETIEAGIALSGSEVKSVRAGRAVLRGAFVTIRGNELYLTNATIPPWQPRNTAAEYNETRPRKLLVHRQELSSLIGKMKAEGLTAIPLRLYTRNRRIKVEIGIVRHRKKRDQREAIKKRDAEREMQRHLKR